MVIVDVDVDWYMVSGPFSPDAPGPFINLPFVPKPSLRGALPFRMW
jgi:hypothetical protein